MRPLIGILAIAIGLLQASAVQAASQMTPLERDYLAVRDAAIAKLKTRADAANNIDDAVSADNDKALAALEARLHAIVGPVTIAGFGSPKSNLDTLISEMDFGLLDGLVVASPDGKSRVIVTTEPLFMSWLRGHKNWWGKDSEMPQDIVAAVRTEAFYTQATSQDAAMVAYGEVPVRKTAGATFAFAILGARTQDQNPPAPDQMFVTLVKAGRVFLANAPLAQAIVPDPSCAVLRETFHQRSQQALDAYRAKGVNDKKLIDGAEALENDGDFAQRRCVGEKMTADQRAQATKQAQEVVEVMAK
jgi:hypothetical protein